MWVLQLSPWSSPPPQIPFSQLPPILSPPSPVLSPAPPPSPIRSLGYRAAMIRLRDEAASTSHSPPLQLPSASRREDRPEVTLPPRKRLDIALGPRYEVRESSSAAAARPAGGFRADYGFLATVDREIMRDLEREVGYGITDSWDEIVETLEAWVRTTDASDLVHGGVMSLRTTMLGNQFNGSACKARVETIPDKDYILLPLWTLDPLFSSSSKDSFEEPKVNQEKDSVNSTNRVNAISSTVNAASNEVNAVGRKPSIKLPDDLNMPDLEDISIFKDSNENVFGAEADLNKMETTFQVSLIPVTRIYKDHLFKQIIGDIHLAPQTRRMIKSVTDHEPKKLIQALTDPSWIEVM
nr:hypothetical protein [Tanacetum cinerariifolium]